MKVYFEVAPGVPDEERLKEILPCNKEDVAVGSQLYSTPQPNDALGGALHPPINQDFLVGAKPQYFGHPVTVIAGAPVRYRNTWEFEYEVEDVNKNRTFVISRYLK